MNKKILCVLPLSFLVVACSQQGLVKVDSCLATSYNVSQTCKDNPGQGPHPGPHVTVNPRNWATIHPANVCINPGDTITIQLPPSTVISTVATIPKQNTDVWLVGLNSTDNKRIFLTVPDSLKKGEYGYTLITASGGCLDPRATVR